MSDRASESQIASAKAYEELFVPALFGEWAPRVAVAAAIAPGHQVLDVACGTGVLARQAAGRAGSPGAVTGVDPDPGMLAVAAQLEPEISWRRGEAESLPFPDRSFDAVVSQFGLMLFADRRRAVGEMLRVLKPTGRLALAVWGSLESMPAYAAEVALLERVAGAAAANALRAPFTLGKRDELSALLESAGARSVAVVAEGGTARFPSLRTMVEADLRGWLPVMGVHLPEPQIRQLLEDAEAALAPHVSAGSEITFETSALVATATR